MITEDPDNKKKVTPSRQSPPQEAGVLRERLEEILKFYEEYVTGIYQGTSDYNEEVATHAILSALSAAVDGMIPEKMYFNAVYVPNDELSNKIAEGYNAAIAEIQRRRKEAGI